MEPILSFSELIHTLIANRTKVTIGSGESELQGTILAFDKAHNVLTYQERAETAFWHFIPLTSIRSFGYENNGTGADSCYLDLFKK